ncbi:hypothetical protein BJ170DRAFT_608362 [Xylariales sp. AK1849]|nr:hypothetical protein BJ170DRAFT_608362 [Xylariales sp. AK1849]
MRIPIFKLLPLVASFLLATQAQAMPTDSVESDVQDLDQISPNSGTQDWDQTLSKHATFNPSQYMEGEDLEKFQSKGFETSIIPTPTQVIDHSTHVDTTGNDMDLEGTSPVHALGPMPTPGTLPNPEEMKQCLIEWRLPSWKGQVCGGKSWFKGRVHWSNPIHCYDSCSDWLWQQIEARSEYAKCYKRIGFARCYMGYH